MEDDKRPTPTSKTTGDLVHSMGKAGLSSIPVVGGAASELFASLVTPPLEKRRNAWMEEVGERLRQLEDNGLELATLRDNDEFIDIVMSASTAALKTSNKEKRAALRNAVINTASGQTPEESLAQVFISLVDSFTEWHLKILSLFQDPCQWAVTHGHDFGLPRTGSLAGTLVGAYPELKNRQVFYDQVWRDLHQRGLVNTDNLSGMMTPSGVMEKRTSDLGDRFLAFIEPQSSETSCLTSA